MKKIFMLILLSFLSISTSYANIQITANWEEIQNLVSIQSWVVTIKADVKIGDYYTIDYPLVIEWNLETKKYVTFSKSLNVSGNATFGDYNKSFSEITANEISTWYAFRGDILQADNISLQWANTIVWWAYVTQDFSAWSDLLLQGKTFVGWDFSTSMWWEVTGTLVVLWEARWHFDFIFNGNKMVVRWDFRTLEDSKLSGRIYMFADEGHKYKYGNELWKYRYQFSKLVYKDFFWKIDPFLQYDLSDENLNFIRTTVRSYDNEIKNIQENYIENLYHMSSNQSEELESKANKYLSDKFDFINDYIWDNAWQKTQTKKLQYEQEKTLKTFFAQINR